VTAEEFAAEASGPIVQLFHAWLTHTLSQAQILVSDRPSWATGGMVQAAPGVARACQVVQAALEGLEVALEAFGAEVPETWGHEAGEGW
jgi:hypothetical protein